jgi:hypothetical protein
MPAIDAARGGRQFSDAELDEPGVDSPPRSTITHGDKFNQERYSKPHVIEKKKSARAASNASW